MNAMARGWLIGLALLPAVLCAEPTPSANAATTGRTATNDSAAIIEALQQHRPLPVLSAQRAMALDEAYRIGREVAQFQLGAQAPAGFKGGLTSPPAQQKFGASEPLAGVLPADGARTQRVRLADFQKPMLELEIGYRLRERIEQPLPDVETLRALVAEVLPVIELPDLAFADMTALRVTDIIAANASAKAWIAGEPVQAAALDVNTISAQLWRDGQPLASGAARDVLGDQWQGLLWLVNRTVASGWVIEPGQLLITGVMGPMLPLQPGRYRAEFGPLGFIEFVAE